MLPTAQSRPPVWPVPGRCADEEQEGRPASSPRGGGRIRYSGTAPGADRGSAPPAPVCGVATPYVGLCGGGRAAAVAAPKTLAAAFPCPLSFSALGLAPFNRS